MLGTSHDVLVFSSSGTGAMEAAVSNLFSRGDKVIVCSAGKFGERWVEIASAFGLEATVLKAEYGEPVTPDRVEAALAAEPATRGVFVQASETSTGVAHDVRAMAQAIAKTDAIFVVDAITGIGTMPLDIDGWGLDVLVGGSQKAFMIPPGLAFLALSPKAWRFTETATLPHYYFDLKKEKKNADKGESGWTPSTSLLLALDATLNYIKQLGMAKLIENAQLLARATRAAATELGLELFAPHAPAASVTAVKAPAGWDSGVIVKEFRNRFGADHRQRPRLHEGQDFPHRPPGLLRFRGPVRSDRGAGDHSDGQRLSGDIRDWRGGRPEGLRRGGPRQESRRKRLMPVTCWLPNRWPRRASSCSNPSRVGT